MDAEQTDTELEARKNATSFIWRYFGYKITDTELREDLEVLESENKALCPLQDFTDALSGEHYVSISYVKPALHLLNTSVLAEEEEDTGLTKSLKSKILNYLNEKYEEIHQQQPVAQTSNVAMDKDSLDVENPPAAKAKKKILASFFKENTCTTPTASTIFDPMYPETPWWPPVGNNLGKMNRVKHSSEYAV
ncbi:unnamed protein product [Leuciscus chuanchicus]